MLDAYVTKQFWKREHLLLIGGSAVQSPAVNVSESWEPLFAPSV